MDYYLSAEEINRLWREGESERMRAEITAEVTARVEAKHLEKQKAQIFHLSSKGLSTHEIADMLLIELPEVEKVLAEQSEKRK